MSDSTQQYILAKPISRDRGTDDEDFGGYYVYTGESSDAHAFIYPDGFDELFVPLDISAIQKQLEIAVDDFQQRRELSSMIGINSPHYKNDRQKLIAEVLAVFGLENKETDK